MKDLKEMELKMKEFSERSEDIEANIAALIKAGVLKKYNLKDIEMIDTIEEDLSYLTAIFDVLKDTGKALKFREAKASKLIVNQSSLGLVTILKILESLKND